MIELENVLVRLGGRTILDGVSLRVADGESVALVGPNGAGKTTLLRCLLGLVRFSGRASIDGVDLSRDPVAAKRGLGYMPQVPAFCEERADASLRFLAALRGADAKAIPSLLDRVGLTEHARRRVGTFSMGMRQRLSLAAALLGDPPVLVLDEPTASLDLGGQREVMALFSKLREEGRTLLLSSHRAEEVRALADRVVVLDEGRIVTEGSPDEVIGGNAWVLGPSRPAEPPPVVDRNGEATAHSTALPSTATASFASTPAMPADAAGGRR